VATRQQHESVTNRATYSDVVRALQPIDLVARGGFHTCDDGTAGTVVVTKTVVVIGNIGGTMWPKFTAERTPGPDPLDRWTREQLVPIAETLGASFVHPSDEPFQPFQRWAQLADDVWASPIGLLIHRDHGLWHAYRGAFLFDHEIADLPEIGRLESPCLTCADQPCLSACPVDAFGADVSGSLTYDAQGCRAHVASGDAPTCLTDGCAARCACPVNADGKYERDQMEFHMAAFVGFHD
jgi:ferredoxin-like protein FixX